MEESKRGRGRPVQHRGATWAELSEREGHVHIEAHRCGKELYVYFEADDGGLLPVLLNAKKRGQVTFVDVEKLSKQVFEKLPQSSMVVYDGGLVIRIGRESDFAGEYRSMSGHVQQTVDRRFGIDGSTIAECEADFPKAVMKNSERLGGTEPLTMKRIAEQFLRADKGQRLILAGLAGMADEGRTDDERAVEFAQRIMTWDDVGGSEFAELERLLASV